MPLRVAAIDFLNPAPLMWDFHHEPLQSILANRYNLHLTTPSQCAAQLLSGEADLGLIPVAALTPALRIVPGCAIASLHRVRSIQLIVKQPLTLAQVRTVAADTASRSSIAYAQILFRHFLGTNPTFNSAPADPQAMLASADAALLIGDPALLALERQSIIEAAIGPCIWHDLAELWHSHTALPWVAAVWAVRAESVPTPAARAQLIADLTHSRDQGLANIDPLVTEWTTRIAIAPAIIRAYLTQNIHYHLTPTCLQAITLFRQLAATNGILPPLPNLSFL